MPKIPHFEKGRPPKQHRCDVVSSGGQRYKSESTLISNIKRFQRYLVIAVLLYAVTAIHAVQQKGATESPSPAAAATAPSSDSSPFEIAPGIPLPPKGIVWILDKAEGELQLVRVNLSNATFNRHVGENVARTQFFLKSVATLELPDAAAKLRVNSRTPVIYVHRSVEEEEVQPAATGVVKGHYVLLRTRIMDGRRVIYGFSESPFFGKFNRQKEDEIDVISEEIAAGEWLKLTPKQPLPDGEYAVNKLPNDKKIGEKFVYDFGIGALLMQPPHK